MIVKIELYVKVPNNWLGAVDTLGCVCDLIESESKAKVVAGMATADNESPAVIQK